MRTGLVRKYGPGKSATTYIELAGKDLHCYPVVIETAKEMYNFLAMNSTFTGITPTMRSMVLLFLAAKAHHQLIYASDWKGLASYNTLLEHARKLKPLLENKFPNLQNVTIG